MAAYSLRAAMLRAWRYLPQIDHCPAFQRITECPLAFFSTFRSIDGKVRDSCAPASIQAAVQTHLLRQIWRRPVGREGTEQFRRHMPGPPVDRRLRTPRAMQSTKGLENSAWGSLSGS